MKKTIFLILALLGIVLPMSQFVPASIEGEFSLSGMFAEMTATRTITGVTLDFLVVVLTAIVFAARETARLKIRHAWIPLIGTFLIGASFGLPFFLYLRERALEAGPRGREPA
jgi:hypothetical protein